MGALESVIRRYDAQSIAKPVSPSPRGGEFGWSTGWCGDLLWTFSEGGCSWGEWFPTTYAALASVLGKSTESIRRKYIPELVAAGFIEKETEQGFDRRQRIPKRTCHFRIKWHNIINNQ